ncbi:DUF1552 domain-containing protein [Roseimicrobium sp. ORNL1]|uniref:DUF1552 domain-containing protein n=1 Tax=Roseimicrobium sp. ORNL1 TaxID=2711231 RepID=UPI0013E139FB|nr:DUF1552 domain-containing protein [Roseimicrobium sp. ORNL1]QIF03250.1 DUF1552 domain-containing protein [Roseimicrobium sp. ORNL1]
MPSFIIPKEPVSRRRVLRGLGATIALPFLNAMCPSTVRAASSAKAPVRMAFIFMPNGVRQDRWTPEGTGADYKLSPILQPLERHRGQMNVLTELGHMNCREGDGHYAKTANWLTGTKIAKTTGKDLRCGVSIDQYYAQQVGHATRFGSLELGTEPIHTGVDFNVNYTQLYGSHISWRTPTSPLPPEINPRFVFDRLFRENAEQRRASAMENKSVLDLVLADAKALRSTVGQEDQQKLDEYLDSIRSVERRIEADIARVATGENLDPAVKAEITGLDERISKAMNAVKADPGGRLRLDHTEHSRLMMDLITLSFWSDSTRAASFMFGWAVSGKNFSFLPDVKLGHHESSHHESKEEKLAQYEKINIWHSEQFAYMLDRMKSIKEGEGTLLDNSLVMFGSSLRDGNSHNPKNLPILLAGNGGGIKTGQHHVYGKDTPLCNLFLSMLQAGGVKADRFGDSTGTLQGLV